MGIWEDILIEMGIVPPKKLRQGFAAMETERVRELGRKGGKKGKGHRFEGETAKAAGYKGAMTRWTKWRAERAVVEKVAAEELRRRVRGQEASSAEEAAAIKALYGVSHREYEQIRRAFGKAMPPAKAETVSSRLSSAALAGRQTEMFDINRQIDRDLERVSRGQAIEGAPVVPVPAPVESAKRPPKRSEKPKEATKPKAAPAARQAMTPGEYLEMSDLQERLEESTVTGKPMSASDLERLQALLARS